MTGPGRFRLSIGFKAKGHSTAGNILSQTIFYHKSDIWIILAQYRSAENRHAAFGSVDGTLRHAEKQKGSAVPTRYDKWSVLKPPDEVETLKLDQIEVKSYVGGLVKAFERKAA